jgi:hypothetical protein
MVADDGVVVTVIHRAGAGGEEKSAQEWLAG